MRRRLVQSVHREESERQKFFSACGSQSGKLGLKTSDASDAMRDVSEVVPGDHDDSTVYYGSGAH